MATSSCHLRTFKIFLFLLLLNSVNSWDTENLELYDLVEEVNENFYDIIGVERDASSSEIKKAYRKKTLVLHPDKNEAVDAEEQFRKLVAVYEVLKDDEKRERYNHVLDNGLPDWRQPVYYYRKARKLGLAELCLLLCVIVTIGHYFVMWAVYLERRLALEDFFESKKKRETKKKKCKAAAINEQLEEDLHETLQAIPKPSLCKLWPVTFSVWVFVAVRNLPGRIRHWKERRRLMEEWKRLQKEERAKQEALYREEQELRKQKRKMRVEPKIAELTESDTAPVVYEFQNQEEILEDSDKQTVKTGDWTDEDFVMLSKAYIKYPGGTMNRWEKIAAMVCRPVDQVTAKCKQMKGNFQMQLDSSVQAGTKKSKKQIDISDEIISTLGAESLGPLSEDSSESTVRKRNRTKANKDKERTLMISEGLKTAQNSTADSVSDSSQPSKELINGQTKQITAEDKLVVKVKVDSSKDGKQGCESSDGKVSDVDTWSQNQQVILEWALKQYPKTTEQRWEKIAEHIPGKTKEDCVARFKYLAELVKQKRQLKQS